MNRQPVPGQAAQTDISFLWLPANQLTQRKVKQMHCSQTVCVFSAQSPLCFINSVFAIVCWKVFNDSFICGIICVDINWFCVNLLQSKFVSRELMCNAILKYIHTVLLKNVRLYKSINKFIAVFNVNFLNQQIITETMAFIITINQPVFLKYVLYT